MRSIDIFLDRIECGGIVVATNNADDFSLGTVFTELVKVLVQSDPKSSLAEVTELWSTAISLRVTEAIIFRKPVEIVPRGWSVGLRLEGLGMAEISKALENKGASEFIHLRASSPD